MCAHAQFLRAIGLLVAMMASVAGLYASFEFNWPTGAAVICALGAALLLTAGAAQWLRKY